MGGVSESGCRLPWLLGASSSAASSPPVELTAAPRWLSRTDSATHPRATGVMSGTLHTHRCLAVDRLNAAQSSLERRWQLGNGLNTQRRSSTNRRRRELTSQVGSCAGLRSDLAARSGRRTLCYAAVVGREPEPLVFQQETGVTWDGRMMFTSRGGRVGQVAPSVGHVRAASERRWRAARTC